MPCWQPWDTGTCETAGIQGQVKIRDHLRTVLGPALHTDLHHRSKQVFPEEKWAQGNATLLTAFIIPKRKVKAVLIHPEAGGGWWVEKVRCIIGWIGKGDFKIIISFQCCHVFLHYLAKHISARTIFSSIIQTYSALWEQTLHGCLQTVVLIILNLSSQEVRTPKVKKKRNN